MLTTTSRTSSVQWLIESRPPSLHWARPSPQQSNQPLLELIDHEPDDAGAVAPVSRGVRVSMVKARWTAKQRPGLPDAREWSTTLALAVIQALLGQRSPSNSPQTWPSATQAIARTGAAPGMPKSAIDGRVWTTWWALGENNNQWHPWRPITDRPQDLNVAKFSMKPLRSGSRAIRSTKTCSSSATTACVWTTYWVLGDRDWHPWFPITDASQSRDQAHPRHPDQALFQ